MQEIVTPWSDLPAPEPRVWCPRCHSQDVIRRGLVEGTQKMRCKACTHEFLTALPPLPWRPPVRLACRHCGQQDLVRWGKGRQRTQRYKCHTCKRLMREGAGATPAQTRVVACRFCGGERLRYVGAKNACSLPCPSCTRAGRRGSRPVNYPYRIGISLDVLSHFALKRYVETAGISQSEAVRRISHAEWERQVDQGVADPQAEAPPRESLVDVRAYTLRKRFIATGGTFLEPLYYIERSIAVCLDEAAWKGLLLTAWLQLMTHQEAARWLIRATQPPLPEKAPPG